MAEDQPDIQVFNQTDYTLPLKKSIFKDLALSISENEDAKFKFIEVVYVDEEAIVDINKKYLDHDYITDIITFRYDESDSTDDIEGTIFCCAPRIIEQSEEFDESTEQEFLRIYIHGLLHLVGYTDKSDDDKQQMSKKEDFYLDIAASL
jgi:rRNA maturation RNase YbeY